MSTARAESLTPQQRTLRARIAVHTRLATEDAREMTAAARAANPGQLRYWESKVDPDGSLPAPERARRAEHARSAHFARLALASSKARARKRETK